MSSDGEGFHLTLRSCQDATVQHEHFHYLVIATGHFTYPNVPYFDGIETFPGRVMHAHDFRNAREFRGQRLLVVGNSFSGEDIAVQALKFGAQAVTVSYRNKSAGVKWPNGVDEHSLLTRVNGRRAMFADGAEADYDSIILCTGNGNEDCILKRPVVVVKYCRSNLQALFGIF